ncbi:MAG: sugar ABC transporter permease [Clostridium sp.]|uniref:carbohydrate ABC transporter permease n=1 Tax=Clostridium sp. TaxID=1506 RepID=UPI002A862983|nr:sugar ABC transporter permease [Clostridium sp.]MDY5097949.1 sugar ABC transporter permease [Clostridium sp.]
MSNKTVKKNIKAYLYLLPALILTIVFVIFPLIKVFRMGFYTKFNFLTDTGTGIGFKSFSYVLNDPSFLLALKNTLIIFGVGLPISLIISLLIAVLINSKIKCQGLFQTLYFLPYVTSIIAIGIVFRTLFHSEYGYFNYIFSLLNMEPLKWLSDPKLAIWAVTIFYIWSGLAFKIILFLAGLQKIDPQIYKAAKIDGASRIKTFFRVTLPLLSPTMWMVIMVSVIYSFKIYNEIFSLFNGTPGPANSAMTLVYYIYDMFYNKNQVHYASAAAIILFIIIMAVTILQKQISKRFTHYN